MDDKLVAPCGAYCGTCKFLNKEQKPNCLGCGRQHGKLFWGECKLYKCVKNHQVDHCGVCKDFPCNLFIGHFDPAHGQERNVTENVMERQCTIL